MKTAACEVLGIEFPIIQAPMQGAVGPPLVAAVSNAKGAQGVVAGRGRGGVVEYSTPPVTY